ncbi:MAG: helix-turn-helix transcriptional regulator [Acidobacteriota bacterium]
MSIGSASVGSGSVGSASVGARSVADPLVEAQRARERLRALVEDADLTLRAVERRAGMRAGYLSHVLNGQITLTMRHILWVLAALEVSPAQFFGDLHPRAEPRGLPERLSQGVLLGVATDSLLAMHRRLARCEVALRRLGDESRPLSADR